MILHRSSSLLLHRLRDAGLIWFSLFFLPMSTFVLLASYVFSRIFQSKTMAAHQRIRASARFRPKKILVTGVGMTKGLCLARIFYEAGHDVTGADFSDQACGRYSVSLKAFYHLQKPTEITGSASYIQGLIDIITRNHIDLWVSCSGVASAVQDGEAKEIIEARTNCKAVQFNVKDTQILHEKHSFIERTAELGLTVPETHTITSQAQVEKILGATAPEKKYIMKTIGMVDAARSDMTLLPMSSMQATENYISQREISQKSQWILQQYLSGPEYCTHALVIRGIVKAFVACPSADILMHYEALPSDSALSRRMLDFTKTYAKAGGEDFTGHLSFDFMIEESAVKDPETAVLYPIECNPRAHTAVVLFNDDAQAMVDAYLSLLKSGDKRMSEDADPISPRSPQKYYWVGHDIFDLVLLPMISVLQREHSVLDLCRKYRIFLSHGLLWKDGTYEIWDPLPWWWLYHVYWPLLFFSSFRAGRKWSRMNVSTTKMFEC